MKLIINNLSKDYTSFRTSVERIVSAASLGIYRGSLRMEALAELNLEAGDEKLGEIIGVIGPNGAGKSTLLRILAGNSPPTTGRVIFGGTVRSILELGVGFSPHLTGRENIYYNGRLWGYTSEQLEKSYDEILDFARLQNFADMPLKTYSTGMRMRLGFSLATYDRSDLFLVDEALAVGDASFQQKCIRRFHEFRDQGSLIVVVSHDTAMLRAICDRILLLDGGRVIKFAPPGEAIDAYMKLIAAKSFADGKERESLSEREYAFMMWDSNKNERRHFFSGEKCILEIQVKSITGITDATVGIHISDARGVRVFGTNSNIMGEKPLQFESARESAVRFQLELNLGPGKYTAGFSVHRGRAHADDCHFWGESLIDFEVELPEGPEFEGISNLYPQLEISR